MHSLPTLKTTDGVTQLFVDGEPTLLLGGQVHNSSTSSTESIDASFAKAAQLNYNFVIGPVSWLQSEPIEGQFDFRLVGHMLESARRNDLKLVLLWFGAFKNATSTYTPSWVRRDIDRFPRARTSSSSEPHKGNPVISVFSENLREADGLAFNALMQYLATNDTENRVVMVQVENEIGMLGGSRDHSELANSIWDAQVPSGFVDNLRAAVLPIDAVMNELLERATTNPTGSWAQVFGDDWKSHELFMTYGFASYVQTLAKSGKRIKPLPMFVNAWLGPQPGQTEAGQWPSGGPSKNVLAAWKALAPSVDLLTPDIYVTDAMSVFGDYHRVDNALFIPESRHVTGNLFWALANHNAIGYSVFGAEDGRVGNQLSSAYKALDGARDFITDGQSAGTIRGIVLDATESTTTLAFGDVSVAANNSLVLLRRFVDFAGLDLAIDIPEPTSELDELPVSIPSVSDDRAFGLLIQTAPNEYFAIGKGLSFAFESATEHIEIDEVLEGRFEAGTWVPMRDLNGDERLNHTPINGIGAVRIRTIRFAKG